MKQSIPVFSLMLLGVAAFLSTPNQAQTALLPGDIAITGFNMDNPDEVSVVFLVAIEAGTEIRLTDNGWKASGTFRTGEGIDIWIAPVDYLAGEEVIITTSDMALSSSGDQILVYQGTEETPLFVAAINDEGEHVWQEDAIDASTSALPAGLINGTSCVALTETDNMVYNRVLVSGTQGELLLEVNGYQNWTGSNTDRQVLSTSGFSLFGQDAEAVKMTITSVNGGTSPYINAPFFVMVQSVDSTGNPCPVAENTVIVFSVVNGTGLLYGHIQDTLLSGQSTWTTYGLQYNTAEDNVTVGVEILEGDMMVGDTSSSFSILPLPMILINEIHYNGPEAGTDTSEFIELYNSGNIPVNLGGYSFTQGITFIFPDPSVINPGEYLVIAYNTELYQGQGYQVYQWISGTLSNTGETIELKNHLGQPIDQVTYSDEPSWGNSAPDGYGPSLELKDSGLDNSLSVNWKASHIDGGTPGQANSLAPVSSTWAGGYSGQEHNWAVPSNWLNGQSAGAVTHVTLSSDVNNLLIIDNSFNCQSLLMEAGAMLTVHQGDTLTVGESVILQADSTLTTSLLLEDNLSDVVVHGTSSVQLFLTGGTLRDPENAIYHFVSSPVNQPLAGDVFPGNTYVRSYNEPLQQWVNLTSGNLLLPLTGYAVWLANGGTTVTFDGAFNSGLMAIDGLSYTGPGIPAYNPDYAGYNLIGNPYPSAMNWDHTSIVKSHVADAIYFWNPELEGYSSYINGIGNNPETTDSIIPSMQGFFVRVDEPGQSGSVTFSNEARTHDIITYYKPSPPSWPVFRITASGYGKQDQATISLRQGSTVDYDLSYDAFKLTGNTGVPQVYSLAGDGTRLSVNSFPSVMDNEVVMVGFFTDTSGSYQFIFSGLETFPTGMNILLEDLAEDTLVDCHINPQYSFVYEEGDDPERFLLHFAIPSGFGEPPSQRITIIPSGRQLYIYTSVTYSAGKVFVYDITGRLVQQAGMCGHHPLVMTLTGSKGWMIVQLRSSAGVITRKVYVH